MSLEFENNIQLIFSPNSSIGFQPLSDL